MTNKFSEEMAANTPIKVGTRGTVGSLVMKEIEYFSRLQLDLKPRGQIMDMASSSGNFWPSFGFLSMTWRRKKRRSGRFLQNICSAVEVADSHRLNGVRGFNYMNLKADVKKFEV
ncbi:uncharacterized protein LOC132278299 [Cornus florida]|uniref:uncharacterized protein LOC132278299 n=1 Tax=Cornus florida TaxID=4283 RepID=UPI0028A0715A|nr:uncharacterized protein LOC132278299 [Cornus florida]